jgi:hypothetical protein
MRYCHPFTANIKINAFANVLIGNNRLNDAITDTYEQPNYRVVSLNSKLIVTYPEGWKVPFDYANHYGIVVNRSKAEGSELDFHPSADPTTEPGLFRKGIVVRDNWIYHTMRVGIRASGDGLIIQDNEIRDKLNKEWWTDARGTGQPMKNITYENRAIDWAGWNVLIQGNYYEVYRHKLMDSKDKSIDGEGILIQECCGGTKVNQVNIRNNIGNSYIGLFWTPFIRNVRITGNKLLSNVTDTPLIYVHADTGDSFNAMYNVKIENNIVSGSILAKASNGGSGNIINNNTGNLSGFIKASCNVTVTGNTRFKFFPCLKIK